MKKTLSIKLFLLLFLLNSNCLYADDILKIDFASDIGKGYWGSQSDLIGISDWTLDASNCTLTDDEDYVKVVGTGGGRLEARDIDGEAIWKSKAIDISNFTDISISVLLAETGSSTNSSKYAKAYYILDGSEEILLELNGENSGNWSSVNATQAGLTGSSLEIVVRMNNPNSGDLVYFDDLVVSGNPVVPETDNLTQIKASDNPVESILLSTNCNEKEKALTCFRFVIDETTEAADGLSTKVSRMIFYNAHPNNGMNWKDCLGGICLFSNKEEIIPQSVLIEVDSVVIYFAENQIDIPDAEKMEFELRCFLNSGNPLNDGETFQLNCKDSAKSFETFESGSGFNTANEELSSAIHSIEVEATRMIFSECPDTLIRNRDFSILVNAVDDFNNRDLDANHLVLLSLEAGTGNLESLNGFQNSLVKGEVSFESLKYPYPDFIKLAVSNDVLPKAISESIRVENTYESLANVNNSYSSDSIISSLQTSEADAFEVFRFSVTDSGNDNSSTILEQVRLIGSEKNQVNWKKSIEKFVVKVDGEVLDVECTIDDKQLDIHFLESELKKEVLSEETVEFSVFCFLKEGKTTDEELFQVKIDSLHTDWIISELGSGLQEEFTGSLLGPEFIFDVKASEMLFKSIPQSVNYQEEFTVLIQLVDRLGNIDKTHEFEIELSLASGNGELTSESLKMNSIDSEFRWENLKYSQAENFTLQAECDYFPTIVSDNISGVDKTSLIGSSSPISAIALSSLAITQNEAIPVLNFKISDSATHDQLPTIISNLKFYNRFPGHSFSWAKHISGAVLLSNGEIIALASNINDNRIEFNSSKGVLELPNNSDMNLSLAIFFRKGQLPDNASFQIEIPKFHEWKCLESGSKIQETLSDDIISEIHFINVEASQLSFSSYPFGINNLDEKFSLKIAACDHFKSIDKDAVGAVQLSLLDGNGELIVTDDNLQLKNGIVDFDSIQYNGTEDFRLKIESSLESDSVKILMGEDELGINENFELKSLEKWINNDDWIASSYRPIAGEYSLKHNLSAEFGESYISKVLSGYNPKSSAISWSFIIRNGDWDPSSGNKFVFHLLMDDSDPNVAITKYSVGVNQSGSSDILSLWSLDKDQNLNVLLKSDFNWNESEAVAIRITYCPNGLWKMEYNRLGNKENWIVAGEIESEVNLDAEKWFSGLDFTFETASRAGNLWFDNLKIESINTAPFLKSYEVVGQDSLLLEYSEDLDLLASSQIENFKLRIEGGEYLEFELLPGNTDNYLLLVLDNNLRTGDYQLEISNITDAKGAVKKYEIIQFGYFAPAKVSDVVINEIMADETPSVGLPEYEFIELYNTSEYPISVENWILKAGEKETVLSLDTIPAKAYLVLCANSAAEEFTSFGDVLGVSSFPRLTNSGGTIEIQSAEKIVIDQVSYLDSWYKSDEKSDGGWSLERIDPLNVCSAIGNWSASKSETGGTPGKENSIQGDHIDNLAPAVSHLIVLSKNHLSIELNEEIDTIFLLSLQNYSLANNPVSTVAEETSMIVNLEFVNSFEDGQEQQLSISGLQDECGNVLDTVLNFVWHEVHSNDVVINEIMADETPSVGLPEYEFIELYNTSEYPISVENWILKAGEKENVLSLDTIPAKAYLVLCANSAAEEFTAFGDVLGVSSFPRLTNSGGTIEIQSAEKIVIDQVSYLDSWYKSDEKSDGGWSLERIDPANTSWQANNWKASENELGGTPGKVNSIYSVNQDLIAPSIESCRCIAANCLRLVFSEPIESSGLFDLSNFQLLPDLIHPKEVFQTDLIGKEIQLIFKEGFVENSKCQLILSDRIKDLAGNSIIAKEFEFWVPGIVTEGDLVINEVLFNPYPDGSDYVEIVNISEKVLDLSGLKLATRTDNFELCDEGFISDKFLHPNEYLLVTEDTLNIQQNYYSSNPDVFCQVKSLPTFSDDAGRVVLISNNELIDDFAYNEDMHFELLASVEGVSLERINPKGETNSKSNWQSAAQNIGFGTPGIQNSVYNDFISSNSEISLSPKIFTPDNDGFDDRLLITFNLEMDGYLASVRIYNSMGIEIRKLAGNLNLANKDSLFWDGLTSQNERAPVGIYLVYIELFSPDGVSKIFKETCVLGGKFN